MIDVTCPKCGAKMGAPEDSVGRTAKCKQCGVVLRIGDSSADSERPRTGADSTNGNRLPRFVVPAVAVAALVLAITSITTELVPKPSVAVADTSDTDTRMSALQSRVERLESAIQEIREEQKRLNDAIQIANHLAESRQPPESPSKTTEELGRDLEEARRRVAEAEAQSQARRVAFSLADNATQERVVEIQRMLEAGGAMDRETAEFIMNHTEIFGTLSIKEATEFLERTPGVE